MKTQISFVILLIVFYSSGAYAFDLIGKVMDKVSGTPLPKATVRLEGTSFGALTDNNGFFHLNKIPTGSYFLIVSFIGYEVYKQKIFSPSKDTLYIFLKQQSLKMEEVVVSATKRLQTIQEVPVSISIISNDFLTERSYFRFDEALRQTPGLTVNKDNINIRGSSGFSFGLGSRVAYLIDGLPFLSGDNGDAKYDIIPVELIKKVEVVKGAGSALYGSSAIGGVVNIITKEIDTEFFDLILHSGIYTKPKYEQWIYSKRLSSKSRFIATYGNDFGYVKGLFSASYSNDESYLKYNTSQRINLFTKLNRDIFNYGKLSFFAFYTQDRRDDWVFWNSLDSATIPPTNTDLSRKLLSNKSAIALEYQHFLAKNTFATFKSNLYYTSLDFENIKDTSEYRQSSAYSLYNEFQFNTHFPDNTLLTYGVDFRHNWIHSNIYGRRKQYLLSSFAQIEFTKIRSWIFNLGGRIDWERSDYSPNNFEFSPKLGINYKLSPEKERYLRFSIGSGFRSPALAERFAAVQFGGFRVVPNFNLKAERSWTAEIGGTFEFESIQTPIILDAAIFSSRFSNLIEPQFDSVQIEPVIKFMNITKAEIYGAEFTAKVLLFRFLPFSFSAIYLDPIDLKDGKTLKYRSRINLTTSLSLPFQFFKLTADFRYISKIERIDELLRLSIPNYDARVPIYVLDLYLSADFNKFSIPLKATISLQNALDYYYVEIVGNLAPTRFISLRLEYNR